MRLSEPGLIETNFHKLREHRIRYVTTSRPKTNKYSHGKAVRTETPLSSENGMTAAQSRMQVAVIHCAGCRRLENRFPRVRRMKLTVLTADPLPDMLYSPDIDPGDLAAYCAAHGYPTPIIMDRTSDNVGISNTILNAAPLMTVAI